MAQILTLMDGMNVQRDRGNTVVIAATNRPNAIDNALRRPGRQLEFRCQTDTSRFDREIEVPVPNQSERVHILKVHTNKLPLDGSPEKGVDLDIFYDICSHIFFNFSHAISKQLPGYVGADIAALCRQAAMISLRRQRADSKDFSSMTITNYDFEEAIRFVVPSTQREVAVEVEKITWEDVGGLFEQKKE